MLMHARSSLRNQSGPEVATHSRAQHSQPLCTSHIGIRTCSVWYVVLVNTFPHRQARQQQIDVCRTEQRTVAHWLALPVGLIEVASPSGSEVRDALPTLLVRHRSRHGHIASRCMRLHVLGYTPPYLHIID